MVVRRAQLWPRGLMKMSDFPTTASPIVVPALGSGIDPLHILILTDRDWTHPQGGGTGTHLQENVNRWVEWGHRVTIVAGGYPGAHPVDRQTGIEIRRYGSRATVFPRTIIRGQGALPSDVDVVIEVINGITFLTPIWLKVPHVALVHHVHSDHYVQEMGPAGRLAAAALETIPLKGLYRKTRFVTVSESTADEVSQLGIPRERIHVAHNGVDATWLTPGVRAAKPTLLYLGRIKRYKRIEMLLTALEKLPGVTLEIAGDGDHRRAIEREIAAKGLSDRVVIHGFVSEEEKLQLLQRAWLNVTASSVEGWSLVAMEAAACATPTVAMAVGGLREAVVSGTTGLLAESQESLTESLRTLIFNDELREEMGRAALKRAEEFTWDATAARFLGILREEIASAQGTTVSSQGNIG